MNEREAEKPEDTQGEDDAGRARWSRILLVALVLLFSVGIGSTIRIRTGLNDPNFNRSDPAPLLRSDPALLYYFTERIVESGGFLPDDAHADPRLEYPETSDLPAMFSLGQEFFVAWTYSIFGGDTPLHVFALWVMGIFASLTVIGVFGLTFELTRKLGWACVAAALFLVIAGNYRTIGFILIREDFSLPWLSLHLYLLARAWRVRTSGSYVLAGLAMLLAASFWHAMGFMLTIEGAVILAWFLRTGQNPFVARKAWLVPLVVAVGALIVPVLRSKAFVVSLPMHLMVALLVAVFVASKWQGPLLARRAVALGSLVVTIGLTAVVSKLFDGALGDYSHVFELMSAKVRHLGQLPEDPSLLTFDTRLLWQGPFATPEWTYFHGALGVGVITLCAAAVFGTWRWLRAKGDAPIALLCALTIAGALAAFLVQRTIVLPAMLVPVVAATLLARVPNTALRSVLMAGALLYQLMGFADWTGFPSWIRTHHIPWYDPALRNNELALVLDWIEENVPAGQPIASDFETSTAFLANSGHPMLVQPKYETNRSRRNIEESMMTFFHGSLAEYRAYLARHECRYVLVNRQFWDLNMETFKSPNLYTIGVNTGPSKGRDFRPRPDSAFAAFATPNPAALTNIPGFRLVYRDSNQFGGDFMRVFVRTE